jgi:hypothetical protein
MSATAPVSVAGPSPGTPSPEEVLAQLERLLASRHLRESHQLHCFLEFVVRETLSGRQDGLKEYLLGCQVFGRRPDYDPRHDGIVRVQATTLRKRLEKYYADEGASARVLIELPRGGYVPSFRYRAVECELTPEAVVVPAPAAAPAAPGTNTRPTKPAAAKPFLLGIAVATMACAAWLSLRPSPKPAYRMTAASPADFPQLWGAFFEPGARNLVGFGVPLFYNGEGIYVRDVQVNAPGLEREGRIDEFARKMNVTPRPTDDTYTGVGELVGTNLLASFFAASGTPVKVTNARTIADSDLAGQNLVVVSSLRFQTLLRDLHLPSDFEFLAKIPETIRNLRPPVGERSEYVFEAGAGISTSYALISLWPSVTAGRRILFVGGVHTWATQAATEFVLQPDQLRRMASEFQADRSTGRRGPVSPFFQVLLRVEGRENHSQRVEYVTHHYLPASAKPSK